jgi:hypothetical protein
LFSGQSDFRFIWLGKPKRFSCQLRLSLKGERNRNKSDNTEKNHNSFFVPSNLQVDYFVETDGFLSF